MIEKNNLSGEVEIWKARTSLLIEQCNKSNPEKRRLIEQEREDFKKQVSNLSEENHKKRMELSRINTAPANITREINNKKGEMRPKDSGGVLVV